jgi:hypothetical protein
MLVLDRSVFLTYDPGHNAAARPTLQGGSDALARVLILQRCLLTFIATCAHLFDGWEPWNGENEKEIGDAHQ